MRIQSVDIARGLCIILVVWGHNAQFTDTVLNHALWSIRMPMMFFVAGSFFKPLQPFGQLTLEKADALLKPFVVMALLQAPARMAIGETDLASLALGIVAGGGNHLPWIYYLWYLPHLWLIFMAGHILLGMGRFATWHTGAKLGAIILGLISGIWLSNLMSDAPFKLGALPKNLAFFMLGYMSRPVWTRAASSSTWVAGISAMLVLLGSQYLLQSGAVDISSAEYVISFMLSALAGITMMVILAKGLSHLPLACAILSRCGRESLFILLFHWPLQNLARHAWPWVFRDADPWLIATLSWLTSISLSLALARLMRANYWAAALWLPMQTANKIRRHPQKTDRPRQAAAKQAEPAGLIDFADTMPEANARAVR